MILGLSDTSLVKSEVTGEVGVIGLVGDTESFLVGDGGAKRSFRMKYRSCGVLEVDRS